MLGEPTPELTQTERTQRDCSTCQCKVSSAASAVPPSGKSQVTIMRMILGCATGIISLAPKTRLGKAACPRAERPLQLELGLAAALASYRRRPDPQLN